MLCHALLGLAIPHRAMLCRASRFESDLSNLILAGPCLTMPYLTWTGRAIPRQAAPRYNPCHAKPNAAKSCNTMPSLAVPCHDMRFLAIPYRTLPYSAARCRATPCPALMCIVAILAVPCHTACYRAMRYPAIPCPVSNQQLNPCLCRFGNLVSLAVSTLGRFISSLSLRLTRFGNVDFGCSILIPTVGFPSYSSPRTLSVFAINSNRLPLKRRMLVANS